MCGGILGGAGTQPGLSEVDVPVGSSVVPDAVDYLLHARTDLILRVPATISS